MQNGKRRAFLYVSAILLASFLTGAYSTIIEPTQTNTRTLTRTTESFAYSERTYGTYTVTSMAVTTLRTMRTSLTLTSCTHSCNTGGFEESIVVTRIGAREQTLHNACIVYGDLTVYNGEIFRIVETWHPARRQCVTATETSYVHSLSSKTLSLTNTIVDPSVPVHFPVTVTTTLHETMPNPQKSELQSLTVVLLILAVGIGLVLARMRGATPPHDETRRFQPSATDIDTLLQKLDTLKASGAISESVYERLRAEYEKRKGKD